MIEGVIGTVIIVTILTIIIIAFDAFRGERALEGAVEGFKSALEQARVETLASKNQFAYGLHLETSQYVLFIGPTYDASTSTSQYFSIPGEVEIESWTLAGGGSDIVFDRLTGKTSTWGTTTLRIKNRPTRTESIVVLPSGVISQ